MDIITTNLTRLIIIDDSEIVYNMYKGKLIYFSQNSLNRKHNQDSIMDPER
jgi:hypothetical protein